MRILGVDPSYQQTGFAVVENSKLIFSFSLTLKKVKTKKKKRKRIKAAIKRIEQLFFPDKIIVERTRLYSRGFVSVKTIIALSSLTSTIIDVTDLDVYSVDSRAFKSKIIGSAKCSKKDVINWAESKYGKFMDDDQADAIAIALYPFIDSPLLRKENN